MDMQPVSRTTIASRKYEATKSRLESLFSEKDLKVLARFDQAMIIDGLKAGRKCKILDSILAMSKLLEGRQWSELNSDEVKLLVAKVMSKYSKDGQETNTTSDHKKILQQWFRFLKTGYRTAKDCELELGFKHPKETRRIRIGTVSDTVTAEDLVTRDEKNKLMKSCDNLRDKAIIDVMDDSGVRPHEILEMQIKHIKSDKNGYTLLIKEDSKTGAREVRILEAVPSLADWLNVHPSGDNLESPLFVNTGSRNYGKPYEYPSADKMLKRLCKKAGIRKLHLYLFRHSEVTRRASKLTDGNQRSRHGWSPKSTVLAKYTHLTSKDSNDSLLRAYGIEPDEGEPDTLPKICPSCQRPNSQHREICYCGKPLSVEKAMMMDKKDNEKITSLENQMQNVLKALAPLTEMLNQKEVKIPISDFPKEVQEKLQQKLNHN